MKKVLAIALALVMLFSFAACAGTTPNGGNGDGGNDTPNDAQINTVDMSKYPTDFNAWNGQNFIDYFTEAGVFKEGSGLEIWLQDHPDYWINTPINECAGYWDEDGKILIMIFTFDETLSDTTPEDVAAMKDYIKENHKLPDDYQSMPIDHMAGNAAFSFTYTTDDDVYNMTEAAYNNLITALGVTADF